MKTLKRIFSLLITITLIMSFGLCAYADSDFALDYINITTKLITIDYTANISGTPTVSLKEGGTTSVSGNVTVSDNRVSFVPTEAIDITKDYVLEIGSVTDGTTTLEPISKLIVFDVIVNDNFDSYNDISDLDANYVNITGYNFATATISETSGYALVSDDNGGKKLELNQDSSNGFWTKKLGNAHGKKYYTFEADFNFTEPSGNPGYKYIYAVWHDSWVGAKPSLISYGNYFFECRDSICIIGDTQIGNTNYGYSLPNGTFAISLGRNESNTKDVYSFNHGAKNLLKREGSLKISGNQNSFYYILGNYWKEGHAWVDNYKLYSVKQVDLKHITPVASGKFEENEVISVTHEKPETNGFSTTYDYKWLKSDDVTKAYSEWTEMGTAESLTLTSENCNFDKDYFVCRVTRTLKLNGGEYEKVLTYTTDPICKPFAPVCKDIVYTYDKGETTSTLKAIPTYFDQNGDAEDKENATFNWEISDDNQNWTAFDGTKSDSDGYKGNVIDVTDIIDKYVRCTAKLKSVEGKENTEYSENYTKAYTLPFKPVAKDVSISGTSTIGSVLKASYTYYDENGDSENIDKTEKIWYRKSGTAETKIGEGLSYAITSADAGSAVIFKVTPKNDTYPDTGDTVESSNSVSVAVIVTGGTIGGTTGGFSSSSSGGGSYSSSSTVTTTPTNPEFKPVPEEKEPAFSDIKGHWAKETIEKLNEMGLVNGKSENGFEPDSALTRAEWITLLLRVIGADFENVEVKDDFTDVNAEDWFAKAVQFAFDNNLVSGMDGKFNPNDNVTREQMAKMLIDVLEYFLGEDVDMGDLSFTDNTSISSWAEQYVQKAVSKGLITGTPEGAFNPSSQATRAEACTVLLRLLNIIGK